MSFIKHYLDFILCILEADGKITDEEKELFLKMLDRTGVQKKLIQQYKKLLEKEATGLDPEEVISSIVEEADAELLGWLVRDAYLAAEVDGKVSKEEIVLINKLLEAAGVPKKLHKVIQSWGMEFIAHTKCIPILFAK